MGKPKTKEAEKTIVAYHVWPERIAFGKIYRSIAGAKKSIAYNSPQEAQVVYEDESGFVMDINGTRFVAVDVDKYAAQAAIDALMAQAPALGPVPEGTVSATSGHFA